jgi:hypothetical protein
MKQEIQKSKTETIINLNNAKISKRIVAIVQRAQCNLAILRARSA